MAQFVIEPDRALCDQPVAITLDGLPTNVPVTIRLQFADDRQQIWESSAEFLAGPAGRLDLRSAKPIRGTYTEADAMGLFWSLRLRDDGSESAFPFLFSATRSAQPFVCRVTGEVNDSVVATGKIIRQFYADSVERREIIRPGFVATLFRPRALGSYPAAITVGGSGSNFGWARQVAGLLASYGRAAIAIAYFDWVGEYGLPTELVEIPLETVEQAIEHLRQQPGIDLTDLTMLGFSKGAEMALLAATCYSAIKRVVAYMPSSVVWEGIRQKPGNPLSSWSYRGQQLPFIENSRQGNHYPNMVQMIQQIQSGAPVAHELTRAVIPVEQVGGPILLISGANDRVWPSAAMAELIRARLRQFHSPFDSQHLCLSVSDHAVGIPFLPYADVDPAYISTIAQETITAWQTVKRFLDH